MTETGAFILYATGPTGLAFNFGDSSTQQSRTGVGWLAERFDQPVYAWLDDRVPPGSRLALDVIWDAASPGQSPSELDLPLNRHFEGIHTAFLRSSWDDPDAIFVGFKGGHNEGHHIHLDLGTFVLDGLGERWAIDLGPDDYELPGYFGNKRWTYYRTSTVGHNTLTLNGQNQDLVVEVPITAFGDGQDSAFAIADLSPAYGMPTGSLVRGIALIDRKAVLVQDEFDPDVTDNIVWSMHTRANIALDGRTATLTQNGKTMTATILEPAEGVAFSMRSAHQDPPQQPNTGVNVLTTNLASGAEIDRLAVLFSFGKDAELPRVLPFSAWSEPKDAAP